VEDLAICTPIARALGIVTTRRKAESTRSKMPKVCRYSGSGPTANGTGFDGEVTTLALSEGGGGFVMCVDWLFRTFRGPPGVSGRSLQSVRRPGQEARRNLSAPSPRAGCGGLTVPGRRAWDVSQWMEPHKAGPNR
jgi:hypothetical protein